MERKKYPIGPEFYELYEEIGQGVSASVHRALCIPFNEIVAIKILDFERNNSDLNNISREAQTMILVDHPNVLKARCSFVSDHNLWVVMPYMDGGSCLHILKAAYPDGFEEAVIATILREVLKGLEYLHHHGHIHRDVKAGNILVDARGGIKLGDFGVSACLFDSGDRQRTRNTFVGTPCWMAPEVMEQLHGYDFKADMWSVGITALELAHGHAPFSKYPPMKVLLMTLQNAPPGLDYERDKKFSKSFKQMIAMCLVKEPSKRPSAHKLLKHPFFKQARSNDYIARTILEGLPSLGERLKALKEKDADMLAQKKMPDGEKEEISQNEYKRGISGWNFNIDDMKAQASLIQDIEETIPDKDQAGNLSSLFGLDMQSQRPPSTTSQSLKDDTPDTEDHDAAQNRPVSLPLADICVKNPRGGSVQFEDDVSVAGSSDGHNTSHDSLQHHDYPAENEWAEKLESEIIGRHLEGMAIHSPHWKGGLSGTNLQELALPFYGGESDKQHTQEQNRVNCNGVVVPQSVDDTAFETSSRASKLSASNNEDVEEKSKGPIVQQRGRFKVTSENVDLEKVLPSPALQKSHSVQVFSQLPANSLSFDATPSNHLCNSLYLQLHSILQSNIHQRDDILSLMKLLSNAGDYTGLANHSTDGGSNPICNTMEKSLLESAHDREKELTQELTELQWRLICIQDELQRSKMKNAQE